MEVATGDGSASNDSLKDAERAKIKLNGDLNGSVEGMEVDDDSDNSYRKETLAEEESNVNNGDHADHTSDSEEGEEAEEIEDHEDKDDGEEGEEGEEGNDSHEIKREQPTDEFHESMDIEGDGASLNSEDEQNLLDSDTENEQGKGSSVKAQSEVSRDNEDGEDNDETEEDEEEGDINGEAEEEKNAATQPSNDKSGNEGELEESPTDPEKTPKKKLHKPDITLTPRRSSRTVQKPVRFGQEELPDTSDEGEEESDEIEEITPQDPLADHPSDRDRDRDTVRDIMRNIPRKIGNTTIVVSDTKKLADIAARNAGMQKKEPTLVIIDTNSILSGRGAVPMVQPQANLPPPQPAPLPQQAHHIKPYPGLPVALPAQGLYPPKPTPRPPPILPTLTDDMYVVEAPSFIVPYVYEKPPVKKFKKYLRKVLRQVRKQDDEEVRKEEEEEEAERLKKEKETESVKEEETTEDVKKDITVNGGDGDVQVGEVTKKESDSSDKPVDDTEKVTVKDELSNDNVEDSIKINEIKKEDGEVKVNEKEMKSPSKAKPGDKKEVESSSEEEEDDEEEEGKKKPVTGGSYFDNPLGKFFMQIGMNLVQEFVQTDLLKQQKKRQKMGKGNEETQAAIMSLKKNLQLSKENNEPYTMEQNKCDYCSFKTESKLIMAHHLETPHMRNYVYRCNFCPLEVRGPHDILFHMEAEHNIRGRLERAPAFHQCPQCPFEDNQKGKLTRHLLTCGKKFRPEKNLEPPLDWEPPAKIPRVTRKPPNMPLNNPLYQQALASKNMQHPLLPKVVSALNNQQQNALMRGRGRPNLQVGGPQIPGVTATARMPQRQLPPQLARGSMVYRPGTQAGSPPVIMPSNYQIAGSQLFQKNQAAVKLLNQPSISITPLPRQNSVPPSVSPGSVLNRQGSGSKTTFVICEICDGYIKDLEQLRNHMQWIHKVKIHPKMIYNRPPLNCQKCQFRFFTDQGLERHLLGSHGLVTSSMQDSANKGKDSGRCPVCGRVYQWKLLNHVARDHSMTLKPAHLSYKCTVCTATFGMYKQFENHVYSAHSVVAKRVMDKKNGQSGSSSSASISSRADTATLLKPLKINDEITIIPQPAKKPSNIARPAPGVVRPRMLTQQLTPSKQLAAAAAAAAAAHTDSVQVIDLEDSPLKHGGGENGGIESLTAVKERLRRRKSLEIRQVESEPDHEVHSEEESESTGRSKVNSTNEEDDDDDDDDGGVEEGQEGQGAGKSHDEDGDEDDEDEDEEEQKQQHEDDDGEESEG